MSSVAESVDSVDSDSLGNSVGRLPKYLSLNAYGVGKIEGYGVSSETVSSVVGACCGCCCSSVSLVSFPELGWAAQGVG